MQSNIRGARLPKPQQNPIVQFHVYLVWYIGTCPLPVILKLQESPPHRVFCPAAKMFMLKKKKPQVDSTKQMKAVAWDLSKIALVFVGIRAASVFLNQES